MEGGGRAVGLGGKGTEAGRVRNGVQGRVGPGGRGGGGGKGGWARWVGLTPPGHWGGWQKGVGWHGVCTAKRAYVCVDTL